MSRLRSLAIAAAGVMCVIQPLAGQDLSRYREYSLESSLDAVSRPAVPGSRMRGCCESAPRRFRNSSGVPLT